METFAAPHGGVYLEREVNAYDRLTEIDHKQHPSGKVGKPADITRAALFFADEQSSFISGAK